MRSGSPAHPNKAVDALLNEGLHLFGQGGGVLPVQQWIQSEKCVEIGLKEQLKFRDTTL